jgi:hypothetical protein
MTTPPATDPSPEAATFIAWLAGQPIAGFWDGTFARALDAFRREESAETRHAPAASGEDVERAREVMAEALLDDENPAWNERTVQVIASAIIAAHAQGRAERSKIDEAVVEAARLILTPGSRYLAVEHLRRALAARDDALKALPEDAV